MKIEAPKQQTLWTWGIVFLAVGATMSVFGPDIAAWVTGQRDPLTQILADYLVTVAHHGLLAAGAMLTALAVLFRSLKVTPEDEEPE